MRDAKTCSLSAPQHLLQSMVTTVFKSCGVWGGRWGSKSMPLTNHSVIYEICVAVTSFGSSHKLLMCWASHRRNTTIRIASISRAISMCLTVCFISILTLTARNTLLDKHLTTSRLCRRTLQMEGVKELSWEHSKYISDWLSDCKAGAFPPSQILTMTISFPAFFNKAS